MEFYIFLQDIDECSDGNPCAHNCTNTNNGFECECAVGYKLQNDGVSCEGVYGSFHLYVLAHLR